MQVRPYTEPVVWCVLRNLGILNWSSVDWVCQDFFLFPLCITQFSNVERILLSRHLQIKCRIYKCETDCFAASEPHITLLTPKQSGLESLRESEREENGGREQCPALLLTAPIWQLLQSLCNTWCFLHGEGWKMSACSELPHLTTVRGQAQWCLLG